MLGPFLTKRVVSIDSGEEFCQIASHKAVEIKSMQNEVAGVLNGSVSLKPAVAVEYETNSRQIGDWLARCLLHRQQRKAGERHVRLTRDPLSADASGLGCW